MSFLIRIGKATMEHYWRYDSFKITNALGGTVVGEKDNVKIDSAASAGKPENNSIIFATKKKWKTDYIETLKGIKNSFIIIENGIEKELLETKENNHIVVVSNARLYFAKALTMILRDVNAIRTYCCKDNIIIGENVKIGDSCSIEPFVFIDHDVVIGNDVTIKSGAKIRQNAKIGNNVVIGENSVIGTQGFGIETDEDGSPIRIPHIGGVIIGDNVEIGALSSIVSGTINPTIIEKNCMIDDLNHIAHNCFLGERTFTTAHVELSGSVKIGRNGYISPNATVRNGISVGENCFIGQGSSVQKSFGDNVSLFGNPARIFDKNDRREK